jgi:sigma-E factor negative regulatory protein RseC
MLEEVGTVVELRGKQVALVLCQKSSACGHCASMEVCHIGDDSRARTVEAFNTLGARIGDRVRIVTSTRNFLQSSFVLYIVPLMGLLLGAVLGLLVGEKMPEGPDPNLLSAIIGVAFLVGSFLAIRVGSRAIAKETFMPRIHSILVEDEVYPEELKNGH